MIITHELLLSVGFSEIPNRPTRYIYNGFTGRLTNGVFYFHGFSPAIERMPDLKYMLMLIDYQWQATVSPYPINDN